MTVRVGGSVPPQAVIEPVLRVEGVTKSFVKGGSAVAGSMYFVVSTLRSSPASFSRLRKSVGLNLQCVYPANGRRAGPNWPKAQLRPRWTGGQL